MGSTMENGTERASVQRSSKKAGTPRACAGFTFRVFISALHFHFALHFQATAAPDDSFPGDNRAC
jgi:hypothetical protein